MSNVQISDLPQAVLPLTNSTTFFEVEVLENGIPVSRKVSANNFSGGASQPTLTLTQTDPVDLIDTNNALNVGGLAPATDPHLAFSAAIVQAKANATTAAPLGVNPLGGQVRVGDQLVVTAAGTVFQQPFWTANTVFTIQAAQASMFESVEHWNITATGPVYITNKSRGATLGAQALVQLNDSLYTEQYRGSDGVQFLQFANFEALVDGAAALNNTPGRLVFRTTPVGGISPLERLRISATGQLVVTANGTSYVTAPKPVLGVVPAMVWQGQANQTILTIDHFTPDQNPGQFIFRKARGTLSVYTIVQSGDQLGSVQFAGATGTDFASSSEIRAEVDGTPGAAADMPGRLLLLTSADGTATPIEHLRVRSVGQVHVFSDPITYANPLLLLGGSPPSLAVQGATNTASILVERHSADTASPVFVFAKSRAATLGVNTVVVDGDGLGLISFFGTDGTGLIEAANIVSQVDGTPGLNDMPGRLIFRTTLDGGTTPVERLRINNAGKVFITGDGGTFAVPITSLDYGLAIQATLSASLLQTLYSSSASGPQHMLAHSGSNTLGANATLVNGDGLGLISFGGYDGTTANILTGARISALTDGVVAIGQLPTALTFNTRAIGDAASFERARFNPAGRFLMTNDNTSTAPPPTLATVVPFVAAQAVNSVVPIIAVYKHSADALSGALAMVKTRGTVAGATTVVQLNDSLGSVQWWAPIGGTMDLGGYIEGIVDVAPATTISARISTWTAPSGGDPLERLRIQANGQNVIMGGGTAYGVPPTFGGLLPASVVMAQGGSGIANVGYNATPTGATLYMAKSRSTIYGNNATVNTDDTVGAIEFFGNDGAAMIQLATIKGVVEATPGANDMPGRLVFSTTPDGTTASVERMRILQNGMVSILISGFAYGNAPNPVESAIAGIVIQGVGPSVALDHYTNSATGPVYALRKSRGTTASSYTIVQLNDILGSINWYGANGSDITNIAAQIQAASDATPGAADMPGRLMFLTTPNGTVTPVERMRISEDGFITFPSAGTGIIGKITSADVTRTNTTTLADDATLTFTVLAAASATVRYSFECLLDFTNAAATADVKLDFTVPGDTYMYYAEWIGSAGSTGSARLIGGASSTLTTIAIAAGESVAVHISGTANLGASTGAFALQWAQNTLDAVNGTTLSNGSWMRWKRLA